LGRASTSLVATRVARLEPSDVKLASRGTWDAPNRGFPLAVTTRMQGIRLLPYGTLSIARHACNVGAKKSYSVQSRPSLVPTDETGIPLQPTWSVDELLSSYPKPSIAPEMLARLHTLCALRSPVEGSTEHARLSHELGDLVKLVEAVRLADVPQEEGTIPDGRVRAETSRIALEREEDIYNIEDALPQEALLARAARTRDGFYEIPTNRVARR
jgi:hypothetical protein